jgi:hypothetical protein
MQSNSTTLDTSSKRAMEQFYQAHPPSGCSTTTTTTQALDPGKGIKQVNKQPPNRPNCNIIITLENSIVPTTPRLVSSSNLSFNLSVPSYDIPFAKIGQYNECVTTSRRLHCPDWWMYGWIDGWIYPQATHTTPPIRDITLSLPCKTPCSVRQVSKNLDVTRK